MRFSLLISFFCAALTLAPVCARAQESDDDILRGALWTKLIVSKPPSRPRVGLALSGGGARGFAHAGLLEVLGYAGFPIDMVSGTSMGAVIGSLYANGMSVEEIWKFGLEASQSKVSRDFKGIKLLRLLLTDKLITPTYIERFIDTRLGDLSFEKLKLPFACVAMDLRTGEKIIFTEGELAPAVRASVNLPGIFAPVQYRQRYLVDGGVVDFIPIDAARGLGADWVLASVTESLPGEMPGNVLLSLLQVIDIRGSMLARNSEKDADFLIKPEVEGIQVADFEKCAQAGDAGVIEASRRLEKAEESLLASSVPLLLAKP
ncbi:MAG: patatin-like phospholipase family protein [Elusimicrobia bacterium]|nr:patatin-like phospholipase family protein [Elusimicrobiota bacterium]